LGKIDLDKWEEIEDDEDETPTPTTTATQKSGGLIEI
jgi:hypothetical protein